MRKTHIALLITAISLIAIFIISHDFIGPMLNDVCAAKIEKELSLISLPPNTEIIEIASYCGNTNVIGNDPEIWVGMIIHTELSEEEINDFFAENEFNDYQMIWHVPEDLTMQYPAPKSYMDASFSFFDKHGHEFYAEGKRAIGYYMVSGYYDVFTKWDFRLD
jgi:hypothetical protein